MKQVTGSKLIRKAIIAIAIVLSIAVIAKVSGQFLTLDQLKENQALLAEFVQSNFLFAGVLYCLAYIFIAALSLPGAAVSTLGAGALFGLVFGALISSFSSTVGATVAFLLSRYFLRERIVSWGGERFKTIDDGVKREGSFYLFGLRIKPGTLRSMQCLLPSGHLRPITELSLGVLLPIQK